MVLKECWRVGIFKLHSDKRFNTRSKTLVKCNYHMQYIYILHTCIYICIVVHRRVHGIEEYCK